MDKRRGKAINNLEQLKTICQSEKDYIADLVEVIKKYDDLSDGELKYLANLDIIPTKAMDTISEIKNAEILNIIRSYYEKSLYSFNQAQKIEYNPQIRKIMDNTKINTILSKQVF